MLGAMYDRSTHGIAVDRFPGKPSILRSNGNGAAVIYTTPEPKKETKVEKQKRESVNPLYICYTDFIGRGKQKCKDQKNPDPEYLLSLLRDFPTFEVWRKYWTELGWKPHENVIRIKDRSKPPCKANMEMTYKDASHGGGKAPTIYKHYGLELTGEAWADKFDTTYSAFMASYNKARKLGRENEYIKMCMAAQKYLTPGEAFGGSAKHIAAGKASKMSHKSNEQITTHSEDILAANTPKAKPHTPYKNAEKAKSPQRDTTAAIPDINEPEPAADTRGVCVDCTEWDTCPVRLSMVGIFEGKVLTRCPIPQVKQEPEETAVWEQSPQLYAEQWQCSRCRTVFPMPKPDINPSRFNYNYCPACRATMIEEE